MAKNSITDYDNTAANNADVQSVDISEGCSPSGINNAIREVMADLADVNDGTVTLTSPSVASLTLTGNANFGDNDKAIFGAGNDLQIYHDGSGSVINEAGTGNLTVNSNGTTINLTKGFGETLASFNADSDVELYYDNSKKFETTSTGVDVTGTVTVDSEGGSATVDLRQGSAKAWVNFDGTGTISIRDALNVGSLTDRGTGQYTMNFTNSFTSTDFLPLIRVRGNSRTPTSVQSNMTTSSMASNYHDDSGGTIDRDSCGGGFFGDLA